MSYTLKRGRHPGDELRRLYEEQLTAAIAALTGAGAARRPRSAHASRKHVKKARVLLDIVAGDLPVADAQRELKFANRALGVLSDAQRAGKVIENLVDLDEARAEAALLDRLRAAVIARAETLERQSGSRGDRIRIARLLDAARRRAAGWQVDAIGAATLVRAMPRARRRSRRGRRAAERHPGVETYHQWRRHVKAEWYLFKLAADHTGRRLRDDQRRLAALDACLGRLHDTAMLAAIIAAEPLVPRHESARLLILLRHAVGDLRRRARLLAVAIEDKPLHLKRRVIALWDVPAADRPAPEESWQPAA